MIEYLQVVTTTASEQDARQLAEDLVEQRLAACVQIIGPIQSFYRWQDKVEQATEWQCVAKTSSALLPQVESAIHRRHDYDCPEFVALTIVGGSAAYLEWLEAQLDQPRD